MQYDAVLAETIGIRGHGDDEIEAYTARPMDGAARGGMIVIHHMPGYDAATKEITRRFATMGYAALCPNLYSRQAPGADPDDAAAAVRAAGGIADEQLTGDVTGAAEHLRSLPSSNGKVGVIGYCSGGRHSVLAACTAPVDAAVDCYGAMVVGSPPPNFPLKVGPLYDLLPLLRCPLLGLFGNEDAAPTPDQVDELDKLLTEHGKDHEFHRYDGAGHAFFATDRVSYRPEAAVDGWRRIAAFFGRHLAG
jgi:carboxymethylenebutenolidase